MEAKNVYAVYGPAKWSSAKAKRVLAALVRIGWNIKRVPSFHKILQRPGWPAAQPHWLIEWRAGGTLYKKRLPAKRLIYPEAGFPESAGDAFSEKSLSKVTVA